jgi:hypothetical protein
MIIINLYCEEDYNPDTDGYYLDVAGIINDTLDLNYDPELIKECIYNDFEVEAGKFYELQLIRGTSSADPIDEPIFVIDRIIEKVYDDDAG